MPTIAQAIAEAARTLHNAGVNEERLSANVLLGHALAVERTQLLIRAHEELEEATYQAYLKMVERRAAGEPLQYITGRQEFYGLDFHVTPEVLIPRPETEFLVERILKLVQAERLVQIADGGEILIADIGTGSGCIAITLAHHIEQAKVIAIDMSRAALEVATGNAIRHRVDHRIEFLAGDLLAPLARRGLEAKVDIMASNPPYIPLPDRPTLQREVRDWEPSVALFGGDDGLLFYRRLLAESQAFVKPGGFLVCEIGDTQFEAICRLIDTEIWHLVDITDDLQSIPRTLALRKTFSSLPRRSKE